MNFFKKKTRRVDVDPVPNVEVKTPKRNLGQITEIGTPSFQRLVRDMYVGEVGYVTPWSYDPLDKELNINASIDPKPFGTVRLKIKKTVSGYEVYLNSVGDYKW